MALPRRLRDVLALVALFSACVAGAADSVKVLHVAQGDIDSLDPEQWGDYFPSWVGVAIFEGLYEWDYLAAPAPTYR